MKKCIIYCLIVLLFCFGGILSTSAEAEREDPYPKFGMTSEEINERIQNSQGETGGSIVGGNNNTPGGDTSTYRDCPIFIDGSTDPPQPNELYNTLQDIFNLIKIATPALVIILSLIDYLGAIAKSNDDEVKKANKRTVQRVIIGLAIFFLPFILDIVFDIFGLVDASRCGIGT